MSAASGRHPSVAVPAPLGDYFEAKYRAAADPWDYATSPYEALKYAQSLAALPRQRYAYALEIGCSIGVFTAMLAERCTALLAIDIAPTAVARTRQRCAHLPHVQAMQADVRNAFPPGSFDLIVLSEVGYYWSAAELRHVRAALLTVLAPGGHLLLAHWTPPINDAAQPGDAVHAAFLDVPTDLQPLRHARFATWRLDLLQRR